MKVKAEDPYCPESKSARPLKKPENELEKPVIDQWYSISSLKPHILERCSIRDGQVSSIDPWYLISSLKSHVVERSTVQED